MRIIDKKEKYSDYLIRQSQKYASEPKTYFFGAISIIGLGLYWYQDGFSMMLKVFFLISTALLILFLLAEGFSILFTKVVKKNKLITVICTTLIFTAVTIFFFDKKVSYGVAELSFTLLVMLLLTWTVIMVRHRLKKK